MVVYAYILFIYMNQQNSILYFMEQAYEYQKQIEIYVDRQSNQKNS